MDHTQAKLILSSFRPNGSDLHDPAFAEALALAAEDKELGQWLANERAQDMAFADSLADFPIPESLRESLFEALATAYDSPGYNQFDHDFAGALAGLEPPSNLRGDILAAMEIEQKVTTLPPASNARKRRKSLFSLPAIGGAAAAGIVAALVWTSLLKPSDPDITVASITPHAVQVEAINFLNGNFSLDRRDPKQESLYQFLASNELPSPNILPVGLQEADGIGCKRLDFNNKPASLICYRQSPDQPTVHLLVFQRSDIEGDLPEMAQARKSCSHCTRSGWSIASWRDEDKAFFLLGKMEPDQLAAVF
ncbi:hypothetical protein [Roseibacillus persicicus]|uniref:Uncharacterized protein n=1 Tax=Roseibacillus persicicus TaxID=454148 RepID=A0A918TFP9_9BACT|nr:hypothetical protein [Roseibacillus persicicus]MDQ8191247.1 hypothetical protein [Roseibacillus persicicus]GHC46288.1 hypothetical protein GCM10007100_09840 [Roseibacillus persicicus]